jgi:hypothetical protein
LPAAFPPKGENKHILKAKTNVLASSLSFGEGWGEVTTINEIIKCKSQPKTRNQTLFG